MSRISIVVMCLMCAPHIYAQTNAPGRIPDDAVAQLVALAKERLARTMLGIFKHDGDTLQVSVSSNRQLIAFRNAAAIEKGGRFTPPAAMRTDLVLIECGDADLGERFDCAQVVVMTPAGQRVMPVSYSAEPRAFRNALGATWTVRMVSATYRVRDLAEGFEVIYGDGSGTEWTLPVSARSAVEQLFLTIEDAPLRTQNTGPAPPHLTVTIQWSGEGWRIANTSEHYTWHECVMEVGSSKATLPSLEPNGVLVVTPAQLVPAFTASERPTAWVTCPVGDTVLMVTGR